MGACAVQQNPPKDASSWDFPGGPVVKNLPCTAPWVRSLVGETKVPHATEQLGLHAPTGERWVPQIQRPHATTKI